MYIKSYSTFESTREPWQGEVGNRPNDIKQEDVEEILSIFEGYFEDELDISWIEEVLFIESPGTGWKYKIENKNMIYISIFFDSKYFQKYLEIFPSFKNVLTNLGFSSDSYENEKSKLSYSFVQISIYKS